jgi:hypothetical protein
MRKITFTLLLPGFLLWLGLVSGISFGQTNADPTTAQTTSSQSPFREFVGTFLSDEKAIWTSPLHTKTKDLYWLLPLAGTTGALLATDTDISNA